MFAEMRAALSISKQTDILEHIYSLPTPAAREEAMDAIRAIERTAMSSQQPQPGLVELMRYLDARRLPKGICTRNFDAPVNHLLTKFLSSVEPFGPIITREFRPPKPDPAGILHIARSWGLTRPAAPSGPGSGDFKDEDRGTGPAAAAAAAAAAVAVDGERIHVDAEGARHSETVQSEGRKAGEEADASGLIMVGDSIDDMTAGRRAGATTVLLMNPANEHLAKHEHTDLVIGQLDELIGVLEEGFKGREI